MGKNPNYYQSSSGTSENTPCWKATSGIRFKHDINATQFPYCVHVSKESLMTWLTELTSQLSLSSVGHVCARHGRTSRYLMSPRKASWLDWRSNSVWVVLDMCVPVITELRANLIMADLKMLKENNPLFLKISNFLEPWSKCTSFNFLTFVSQGLDSHVKNVLQW